jgi:IS5 family transposase
MKQTRKGRNWHFGMKLHIGADKRGIIHTVRATHAAVADVTQPFPNAITSRPVRSLG